MFQVIIDYWNRRFTGARLELRDSDIWLVTNAVQFKLDEIQIIDLFHQLLLDVF